MNILIDDLPEEINGTPIRSDYRYMVMFEELIHDPDLDNTEKFRQALDLLYAAPLSDTKSAWEGLLWYYSGGHDGADSERGKGGKFRPVYDFEQDAERIYSAFWQIYGIDLQAAPLHWWTFRALLSNLPDTCLMGEIMRIRATDISKLKGAERKRIRRLQEIYAIKRAGTRELISAAERDQQLRDYVLKRHKEAEEWLKKKKSK